MGGARRWVLLPVLALIIAAMTAVTMPMARANAASLAMPAPFSMNYACAEKLNGQLKYVSTPAECPF
jgi:hypothetical protein